MSLSSEQVSARINGYDEAIEHLRMDVGETPVEREQFAKVIEEIESLRDSFIDRHGIGE